MTYFLFLMNLFAAILNFWMVKQFPNMMWLNLPCGIASLVFAISFVIKS